MQRSTQRRTFLVLLWAAALGVVAVAVILSRRGGEGVLDGGSDAAFPDLPGTGLGVDEATARALFAMSPETFRYDPVCYYRYDPYVKETFDWPEHPKGKWTRRTNLHGWRENTDRQLSDHDVRVLVTGDSHTDGACNNDESFAHRLEEKIQAREDGAQSGRSVAVQNSGIVGYSFHNYLGVLRMHLDQDLDAFVVAVYGGNDFAESLKPHHYLRGTRPSTRRTGYWSRIEEARKVSDHAVAQGLNQVLLFDEQPEEIEVAIEAVRFTAKEIRDLCALHDVRLLFAYIPPAYADPWPELEASRRRAMDVLGLDEQRLRVDRRLKQELFDALEEFGIDSIDLTPVLFDPEELCYWRKDQHVNLLGHRRIADVLFAQLASGAGAIGAPADPPPDGWHVDVDEAGHPRAAGVLVDGEPEGYWREWFPSGAARSFGRWTDGKREGPWCWWYPGGGVQRLGAMRDGRPHGVWLDWHSNGWPAQWGAYVHGAPWGLWLQWRSDGAPMSRGCYVAGRRWGDWITFHADGSPEARATFLDDEVVGEVERFEGPR